MPPEVKGVDGYNRNRIEHGNSNQSLSFLEEPSNNQSS
jgi:hypothetical protein